MYYTIQDADVGKPTIEAFGKVWPVEDFMGQILRWDVGKRVYQVAPDVLQVENEDQRLGRLYRKEES